MRAATSKNAETLLADPIGREALRKHEYGTEEIITLSSGKSYLLAPAVVLKDRKLVVMKEGKTRAVISQP